MHKTADLKPTDLLSATRVLSDSVGAMFFGPPVTHIYNPLVYAEKPHELYVTKYGGGVKKVLMIGMNPGPWGMAQTGVPFGEIGFVRDWLGIEAPVSKPKHEHPKRPIEGFSCQRSEVSGRRLWGWIRDTWKTPKRFFASYYVANYCPLVFMEETGRNRTPDKLPAQQRDPLFRACDLALVQTVELLKPQMVIGIGAFAAKRAALALSSIDVHVATILHPSPASPAANKGWAEKVTAQFAVLGIKLP